MAIFFRDFVEELFDIRFKPNRFWKPVRFSSLNGIPKKCPARKLAGRILLFFRKLHRLHFEAHAFDYFQDGFYRIH